MPDACGCQCCVQCGVSLPVALLVAHAYEEGDASQQYVGGEAVVPVAGPVCVCVLIGGGGRYGGVLQFGHVAVD